MSAEHETPIAVSLGRLTPQWVAYSPEGVNLRTEVRAIARAHGAHAEVVVQADGAVLSDHDGDRVETIAVVSGQSISRLDRFTDLKSVIERAKDPDADLDAPLTGTERSDLFAEPAPGDFPDVVAWLGWVLLVTMATFGVQQGGRALFGELIGTFLTAVAMIVRGWVISNRLARPPLMVLSLSGFFVLTGAVIVRWATD